MSDDIIVNLGRLATARPTNVMVPRQRYVYLPATPVDGRRDSQHMTGAELLPAVSAAFEQAGLDPVALVVTGLPGFPVMSPAGDLVAELWHDRHRPHWHATRYGDRWTWETATGTLEELVERIAEWMAATQQGTASQPRRSLPPGAGQRAAETEPPVTAEPGPSDAAPAPAAPTPTPATPAPPASPVFLVTSPTYSLVAELWQDPHRPHWHAARHENGRTQETATGTLARLAERIAQWAPPRNMRETDRTDHERDH